MRDNIINVNFTAKHKRRVKIKNYILAKLKKLKKLFTFKNNKHKQTKDIKNNYHKSTM